MLSLIAYQLFKPLVILLSEERSRLSMLPLPSTSDTLFSWLFTVSSLPFIEKFGELCYNILLKMNLGGESH